MNPNTLQDLLARTIVADTPEELRSCLLDFDLEIMGSDDHKENQQRLVDCIRSLLNTERLRRSILRFEKRER